ncbi:MAG: hypothetical protein LW716_16405, partial [Microcystis sp. 53602_E8]|nr:hypothetical protein [Microcystis sp. 53602_E8]
IDPLKIGKTLHPTPHTLHPAPRKNFFSKPYVGFAEKVGAKHSDRKSTVSAIGYARMLRPYKTTIL